VTLLASVCFVLFCYRAVAIIRTGRYAYVLPPNLFSALSLRCAPTKDCFPIWQSGVVDGTVVDTCEPPAPPPLSVFCTLRIRPDHHFGRTFNGASRRITPPPPPPPPDLIFFSLGRNGWLVGLLGFRFSAFFLAEVIFKPSFPGRPLGMD